MSLLFTAIAYILKAFAMPQPHCQKVSLWAVCSCVSSEAVWESCAPVQVGSQGETPDSSGGECCAGDFYSVQVQDGYLPAVWGFLRCGAHFSAEVLKYEIDSLGSCEGWRHCKKEAADLYWEELSSSLDLSKAVLCSKGSGDKEKQQPCTHVKGGHKDQVWNWNWLTLGWLRNLQKERGQQCESRKGGWVCPLASVSEHHNLKYGRGKWAVITGKAIHSLMPGFQKLYVL